MVDEKVDSAKLEKYRVERIFETIKAIAKENKLKPRRTTNRRGVFIFFKLMNIPIMLLMSLNYIMD